MVLAACGSQLDPDTVAQVNGTGTAAQGGTVGGGNTGGTTGGTTGGNTGGTTGGTTGGNTGGTTGGTTGGNTGGNSGNNPGSGGNAPAGGGDAGNCDGFKNSTGISDDTITIGNASDISGPVPGLFESSQDAVKAYVAYFNSGSDICGRKLDLKLYDSRTDAGADQQAATKACDEDFAMVGSMSAFDSGGASTTQSCGLPDIRAAATTGERNSCNTCFGTQSSQADEVANAIPDFILDNYGDAGQHAAMLYINVGAAAENGKNQASAMSKRGMHFDYVQGIDIAEFNYAPYVQQMKDKGIESVQFFGAYQQSVRLAQAMQQQGFEPKIYLRDPTDYTPAYSESGGDAVEGTVVFLNFVPFEEANRNDELTLYLSWLQQVKPGATPSYFGLLSWSATRLFVERATALGGKLTRAALVADVANVKDWTANGLHAPQQVGAKHTGDCWRFIQLDGGVWRPIGGTKYLCHGLTTLN